MIVEGRRRFDQMSLPWYAGWGAVGGLLFSLTFVLAAAFGETGRRSPCREREGTRRARRPAVPRIAGQRGRLSPNRRATGTSTA